MDGVEVKQAINLADAFLHELVLELDHEDIVGITLGGSYARGTATQYSDVDLACFWREGVKPPLKRFLYRQDKLIIIKINSEKEIPEMMHRTPKASPFVLGAQPILLTLTHPLSRLPSTSS